MTNNFKDILKVEGVNFKGFGIIPKLIMFDRNLSLEAKAIYAYFASYAGNGTSSFPGRDYILKQLKVSKKGYYGHYNQLLKEGYIKVQKHKSNNGVFAKNTYILVSNPPNVEKIKSKFNINKEIIKFTGIKSLGYGMIPKAVMIDERLTLKAKGIYAYFASYTGSGHSSFPKRDNILFHLNISESTYYAHYNKLIELNYLTKKQRKLNGRLSINDYFLVDNPDELIVEEKKLEAQIKNKLQYPKKEDTDESIDNTDFISHPKKKDTDNSDINIQYPKKEDMEKEYAVKEYTEKEDTNSNSIKSNSFIKIIPSFKEKEGMKELEKTIEEIEKDIKDNNGIPYYYCQDPKLIDKTIKYLIQYDDAKVNYEISPKKEIYEMSIRSLVNMITTKDYTIYKGSKLSYAKVLDMVNEFIIPDDILSLTYLVESFVDKYISISEEYEIKSYKNHMKSCLIQYLNDYKIEFAVNLNRMLNDF